MNYNLDRDRRIRTYAATANCQHSPKGHSLMMSPTCDPELTPFPPPSVTLKSCFTNIFMPTATKLLTPLTLHV